MLPKRGRTIKELTNVRKVLLGSLYNKCANPMKNGLATEADLRNQAFNLKNTGCLDCSVDELTQTLIDVCELKEATSAQESNTLQDFKLTKTVTYKSLPSCFQAGRSEECMTDEFGEEVKAKPKLVRNSDVCAICTMPKMCKRQMTYEELVGDSDAEKAAFEKTWLAKLPKQLVISMMLPDATMSGSNNPDYSYYSDCSKLPCGHTFHTACIAPALFSTNVIDTYNWSSELRPCTDTDGATMWYNDVHFDCPVCNQQVQLQGMIGPANLSSSDFWCYNMVSQLYEVGRGMPFAHRQVNDPFLLNWNLLFTYVRASLEDVGSATNTSRFLDVIRRRAPMFMPVLMHEMERISLLQIACGYGLIPCSAKLRLLPEPGAFEASTTSQGNHILRNPRMRFEVEVDDAPDGNCFYKGPTLADVKKLDLKGTRLTKAYAAATGKTEAQVIIDSYLDFTGYVQDAIQRVMQGTIQLSDILPEGTSLNSEPIEIAEAYFKVPEA